LNWRYDKYKKKETFSRDTLYVTYSDLSQLFTKIPVSLLSDICTIVHNNNSEKHWQ